MAKLDDFDVEMEIASHEVVNELSRYVPRLGASTSL
jgi:hypothetical protein